MNCASQDTVKPIVIRAMNKDITAKCVECNQIYKTMDAVVHRCAVCVGFMCSGRCRKDHPHEEEKITYPIPLYKHQRYVKTVRV